MYTESETYLGYEIYPYQVGGLQGDPSLVSKTRGRKDAKIWVPVKIFFYFSSKIEFDWWKEKATLLMGGGVASVLDPLIGYHGFPFRAFDWSALHLKLSSSTTMASSALQECPLA